MPGVIPGFGEAVWPVPLIRAGVRRRPLGLLCRSDLPVGEDRHVM